MEIIELIRQALTKKGIPVSFATFIHAEKPEDVEGAVATFETAYKKELQTEGDRRATQASKTAVDNFREKYNLDEDGKPKNKSQTEVKTDAIPENVKPLFDQMTAQISELTKLVGTVVTTQVNSTKTEQAKAALKASEVLPEAFQQKWLTRIALESEKSFEDQVKDLETEFQELHQEFITKQVREGDYIPKGPNKPLSADEIRNLIDSNSTEGEAGTAPLNIAK